MKALIWQTSLKPAPRIDHPASIDRPASHGFNSLFGDWRSWAPRTWEGATRWTLVALWALALIASVHPDIRGTIRSAALPEYRSVISTAQGHLLGGAALFTVAKIKTRDALFLEIYEKPSEGVAKLIEKIPLSDRRDGYFNFNGRATNLAVADIDGDGRPEILAPSFDDDLVGRLNVFRFDPASRSVERGSAVR